MKTKNIKLLKKTLSAIFVLAFVVFVLSNLRWGTRKAPLLPGIYSDIAIVTIIAYLITSIIFIYLGHKEKD